MKSLRQLGVVLIISIVTFILLADLIYARDAISTNENVKNQKELNDESLNDRSSEHEMIERGPVKPKMETLTTSEPRKHLLAGYDFSGVIMENGSVWTWGANSHYQLGLNDDENRLHPVRQDSTFNPEDISKVISTDGTTHILLNNGDVYRWGKLGVSQGSLKQPTKIIENVSDVGHARLHALDNPHDSVAFVEDGRVKVYGSAYFGQAGRGVSGYGAAEKCTQEHGRRIEDREEVLTGGTVKNCPNNVAWQTVEDENPLTNVKIVEGSAHRRFFVAVTYDNEIYTWGEGYNLFATKNNNVSIDSKIVELSVGENIYALTEDGDVWEWRGVNGAPVKIDIENVKDVQTQAKTVMILTEDGDVYGKGENSYGQLGENLSSTVSSFTKIRSNIKEIGLGLRHSLFEGNDGKIFGQGWNGYRQLANENDGVKETFTKVDSLSNVNHISSEIYTSFAVANNRELFGWGNLNDSGDMGGQTNSPRKIETFDSDVIKLDSNSEITTILTGALLEDGRVYTWGNSYNYYNGHDKGSYIIGELKHDPNNAAYTPNIVNGTTYVVKDKIGTSSDDLTFKDLLAGGYGGTAINMKGQLLSWGSNTGGLWGVGENHRVDSGSGGIVSKRTRAFVKAKSDEKFTSVDGGVSTRIALQEDGYVYSWGNNVNNSLGRGGSAYLPMRIDGLNNIEKISMERNTGMALDDEGNLYSWGTNGKGQIGDGTVSVSKEITNTSGLSGITFREVFSGRTSQFGVSEEGDLYAWGDNRYGQLGLGGRFDRTSPRKVGGLPSQVKQVDNGEEHTVILLENGDVYVAGADTFGQLGLGDEHSVISYQEIPFPDYVTMITEDNIEKDAGDTFNIEGYVTSIIPGNPLEIKYEIESSDGIVEEGKVKDTISTLDKNQFSKEIKLDDKYKIGGYTINVTVVNKSTGMENTQTINFGVVDNISPTPPKVSVDTSKWMNKNVSVIISDGIDNESGVDYTEYRINNGSWIKYEGKLVISDEGEFKIDSRTVDKAGNRSSIASGAVRIDKTPPNVNIIPNITEKTHRDVILDVSASDSLSGIKRITYLGVKGEELLEGKDITDTGKLEASNNGEHLFAVEDHAGNITNKSFIVDNIVRELKFDGPKEIDNVEVEISPEMAVEASVDNVTITDWRDRANDWKLSMSASQLDNDSHLLPKGTLEFAGVDKVSKLDGDKSGSMNITKDYKIIDDGKIEIISGINERGVYDIEFKDGALKLNLSPSTIKKGTYNTTLTWTLESTPEAG